ncbi:MAG: PIG-L family deacetylase [Actinobacteria bacterium]|nr:PIG-L family deacetylase [Actinomycetota bacterium]
MPSDRDGAVSGSTILAIYAHPDDSEVSSAGTLARWAREGREVHLIICTLGEKGTEDAGLDPAELAATRAQETAAACAVVGIASHENLGYPDGEFASVLETRGRLVERIRALRPAIVMTSDPTAVLFGASYVNHLDHRSVGFAVLDSCAPAAARPHYFPDAGPPHQVEEIFLSGTLAPDTWIDVSDTLEVKVEALRCHRSQLGDEADTMAQLVRARAAAAGAEAGFGAAEGFRVIRFV